MKICMIMNVFSVGGFTASVIPMLKYLSEQGVQVELLLFEQSDIPLPVHEGLTVKYIAPPTQGWKKWALFCTNPYYIYRFVAAMLFDRGRYTHLMTKWMQVLFTINVAGYAPHDLTEFDCVVSWEESFPAYYLSKIVKAKRKVSVFHTDYKIANMDVRIDRKGYRNIDKIITVSEATQGVLQEMLPCYRDKISNFRNVLDVEKITQLGQDMRETPFAKSSFDCITVARLENNAKALDRLVRVCARLKADGLALHWYIVGDGPYRAQFEAQIADAGVGDMIHLLGMKSNPHPYTKQADLFVLQSYYEGKPISVDEALILGTPVLISEYKSAHEQIAEGENGFIAANDEDAIYQKLKHLVQHPELVAQVKENLATQDLQRFTDTSSFVAHLRGGQ